MALARLLFLLVFICGFSPHAGFRLKLSKSSPASGSLHLQEEEQGSAAQLDGVTDEVAEERQDEDDLDLLEDMEDEDDETGEGEDSSSLVDRDSADSSTLVDRDSSDVSSQGAPARRRRSTTTTRRRRTSARRRRSRTPARRRRTRNAGGFIGYGFTQDSNKPLLTRSTLPLFDVSTDVRATPSASGYSMTSESVSETAKNIQAKVGLEGSYGAFSAAATASTESVSSSKVKKFRLDRMIEAKKYVVSLDSPYPHRMLKPDMKEFLLSESPKRIVDSVGQFFATQLTLGGVLQVTNVVEMTSSDTKNSIRTEVEAKFSLGASISSTAEGSVTTSSFQKNSRAYSKWQVLGGNPNIWLSLAKDDSNFEDIQDQWAKSVSDDTLFPIGMKFAPIWHLLDHPEMNVQKARQLETYLKNKWRNDARSNPVWQPLPDVQKPTYRWQAIKRGSRIPAGAVQAGSTSADGKTYVGRKNGEAGKINVDGGSMWNFWGRTQGSSQSAEILISKGPLTWEPIRRGWSIPSRAVQAGSTSEDGVVYVGRKNGEAGKINTSHGSMWNFWRHSVGRSMSAEILVI